ncbi:hypothetical protein XENOCAPTIV_026750 [Xenoophorus captivus]|uniref:Reverse transcriptase n=1 Tax=Xenoophorus captivus TaxID=1517983 RepID=A0ABV0RSY8_9TELE
MNQFACIKLLVNKTTAPNTPLSEQHLGFRPIKLKCPVQSPDLNQSENLLAEIKKVVSERKPRNADKLWNVLKLSRAGIHVNRLQKLVDSMQHCYLVKHPNVYFS